jgi:hypothetical protein
VRRHRLSVLIQILCRYQITVSPSISIDIADLSACQRLKNLPDIRLGIWTSANRLQVEDSFAARAARSWCRSLCCIFRSRRSDQCGCQERLADFGVGCSSISLSDHRKQETYHRRPARSADSDIEEAYSRYLLERNSLGYSGAPAGVFPS